MRSPLLEPGAIGELGWWITQELKPVRRIYALLDNISKTPFEGIGKPEALKGNYSSYWSHRITDEHRLVYKVEAEKIVVFKLKGIIDDAGTACANAAGFGLAQQIEICNKKISLPIARSIYSFPEKCLRRSQPPPRLRMSATFAMLSVMCSRSSS